MQPGTDREQEIGSDDLILVARIEDLYHEDAPVQHKADERFVESM
jgi:hypothetical protein